MDKFTDEKVNGPKLVQLRKKVHATLVHELNLGARVSVKMKDGTIYSGFLEAPKGDPANPMGLMKSNKNLETPQVFQSQKEMWRH